MLGDGNDSKREGSRGKQPQDCIALDDFVTQAVKTQFKLKEIRRDDDGDIPIGFGSTVVYVRPYEEDSPFLLVWAPLIREFDLNSAVYETVNAINSEMPFAKVVLEEEITSLVLQAWLLVDTLSSEEIAFAIEFVGDAADHFDTLLQQRYGGYLANEDIDEDGTVEF